MTDRLDDETPDPFTARLRLRHDILKGQLWGCEQALTAYNQTVGRLTAERDEALAEVVRLRAENERVRALYYPIYNVLADLDDPKPRTEAIMALIRVAALGPAGADHQEQP